MGQESVPAIDSLGLSRAVEMRFETGPLDLKLSINGYTFRTPKVLTSSEGYELKSDGGGR